MDALTVGRRIRHFRKKRDLTLGELGDRAGLTPSMLSLVENGKREPKLSALAGIAKALDVEISDLVSADAPDERSALEIELQRMQTSTSYRALGVPAVTPSVSLPTDVLRSLVALHREIGRMQTEKNATPEQARAANTELRHWMRERDNFLPEMEDAAQELLGLVDHRTGAITHREVSDMAEKLGFSLIYTDDLPASTRSITDLEHGRIYLLPASIPGGHGLRSMALQALAHRVLDHRAPATYAEFLRQRLEINYVAAAVLMPRDAATRHLAEQKDARTLAIEDFRDAFGVTHEAAALRFTNLATSQLDIHTHFLRVGEDGAIYKVYENDGLPIPTDVTGSAEGQTVCRKWAARAAFGRSNRTTENYQYTDTPAGTFWSSVQTGSTDEGGFSITIGVPFNEAKWFRGRATKTRAVSKCPDPQCCREPDAKLAGRWQAASWPSARLHAHILSPLPQGRFPGVDDREVYEFLERHDRGD